MRRLLLIAAALAFEASAQAPEMTVTTRAGEGVLWMGDCVRTKDQRGKLGDPCPTIQDYVAQRTKRSQIAPALIYPQKRDQAKFPDLHRVILWPPTGPDDDIVVNQWPKQGEFKAGWSVNNPVVLMFAPPPPPKLQPATPLVGLTPQEAEERAKRDGFAPKREAPARQAEGVVEYQSPREGTLAPPNSPIEYLVARKPEQCPEGQQCRDPGPDRQCPKGQQCRDPCPAGPCPAGQQCREPGVCPVGQECRAPCPICPSCPPPATCSELGCPIKKETKTEILTVTLGAGGAGLLGGYVLTRVIRRRRDDEDDDSSPADPAAPVLNARMRADRYGTQDVLAFSARRAEPDEPAGGTP